MPLTDCFASIQVASFWSEQQTAFGERSESFDRAMQWDRNLGERRMRESVSGRSTPARHVERDDDDDNGGDARDLSNSRLSDQSI